MGGKPVRESYLAYGKQFIDDDDITGVVSVLKSDFLTCGSKVEEFEAKLCEVTGAKYCTSVANGTAALHVACMAANISEGDEVIVPPITFAASANCVLYCKGTPIFADIDKDTWQMDLEDIKRKISPRTKAIITVDFTGQTGDLRGLKELCKLKQLTLIEDAAHSLGTVYNGKPVGSIADITTFSFHPVKTITTGEGGAVTTNSKILNKKIALLAKHGITRDVAFKKEDVSNWYYEQVALGYNYRLTDIQCALGISQLNKLTKFAQRREEITQMYNDAFADIEEITLQQSTPKCIPVKHLYIIRLNLDKLNCTKKEFYDAMQKENIGVNVHYIPINTFPYYKNLGYGSKCKNAQEFYEQALTLPLFYKMEDKDAEDVINAVKKIIAHYGSLANS